MHLPQRLMGIALAASLLIHAVCAILIPPFSNSPSLEPVETVSFARVRRMEIVRHDLAPRRAAESPTRVAHIPLARIGPSAIHQVPVTPSLAHHIAAVAVDRSAVGDPSSGTTGTVATQSSPRPLATAPPAVDQENAPDQTVAGGYMPFGADEPDPVLDPKALHQLQALGVHVTLTITVGDDGKTRSVNFHPPLGPQLEAQVRAVLAAANWDPAYCGGGVPCQKDASITL